MPLEALIGKAHMCFPIFYLYVSLNRLGDALILP